MEKGRTSAPDGGYGWIIVLAHATSNFLSMPLIHCFGLIFKDTFTELGLSATEVSVIQNLNGAFGMVVGLITGAFLKAYGCRKVALAGAFLLTTGVIFTAYSTSFTHFILSYGLITSLGMWVGESSYTLSLNLYFKENRNKATGLAVSLAGLGPVVIPQLVTLLLKYHTPQGATIIFGGICSHTFLTAVLLQPVEWHTKEIYSSESYTPLQTKEKKTDEYSFMKNIANTLNKLFDLDLLKDPVFLNILLGMSLVITVELNFAILTPYILNEFGLSTAQIATFMSTQGIIDILFRFVSPYIGDYFTQPPRLMFVVAILITIATRFIFIIADSFYALLFVAVALGIGKGIRKVYSRLVIPSHVPVNKLSSASGMELMVNGVCVLIGGPFLGLIRDISKTYYMTIVAMNCISFSMVLLWSLELIVRKSRRRSKKNHQLLELTPT